VARALTNTFSGIEPGNVVAFVIAQIAGALIAAVFFGWLLRAQRAGDHGHGSPRSAS
jgi:hypothetical protein